MRIAIDASPMSSPPGGIRRYTERLLEALSRVDDENRYVLYGLPRSTNSAWNLGTNFSYSRLGFGAATLQRFRLPRDLGEPDVVHGTNYWVPLLDNHPSVLTVHDLTVRLFREYHPLSRRLSHSLLPHHCRRARRIITDSFSTKHDLVRHYRVPADKVEVVYLAAGEEFKRVSCEKCLTRVRERYGLPERFLLFLGSIEPRKNLPALIEAVGTLRKEGHPHRLVVSGRGEVAYVDHLRQLLRNSGLEEGRDCILTGEIADADLPALYSLCESLVYPSFYEGFGLPPLEAMACGAPVVLSPTSSLIELYEGCGLFADDQSAAALASCLRRVLGKHSLSKQLCEAGLRKGRSRSWDDVARETLAIYHQVLAD